MSFRYIGQTSRSIYGGRLDVCCVMRNLVCSLLPTHLGWQATDGQRYLVCGKLTFWFGRKSSRRLIPVEYYDSFIGSWWRSLGFWRWPLLSSFLSNWAGGRRCPSQQILTLLLVLSPRCWPSFSRSWPTFGLIRAHPNALFSTGHIGSLAIPPTFSAVSR